MLEEGSHLQDSGRPGTRYQCDKTITFVYTTFNNNNVTHRLKLFINGQTRGDGGKEALSEDNC